MSPTINSLNLLLETCDTYAKKWKLEFNQKKSSHLHFSKFKSIEYSSAKMDGVEIPKKGGIIYLGLPIGNENFKKEFTEKIFKKCEKSFYSLYGLGCKPYALNPKSIAFLYKQFSQSLFKFGFENLYLSNSELNNFNIRQNIIIKRAIGISRYCKTKPLFHCLKIESVQQIYLKHKIFFYKQIHKNQLTIDIYNFLDKFYDKKTCVNNNTFYKQYKYVNNTINIVKYSKSTNEIINLIDELFKCKNIGLLDSINFILTNFYLKKEYKEMIENLNNFLNYNNYT